MANVISQSNPEVSPVAYGFSCSLEADFNMPAFHRHSEIEIGFVLEGSGDMHWHDRHIETPLRRLTVMWAMIPHQCFQTTPRVRSYIINLPLPWFLSCHLPFKFVSAVMQGRHIVDCHASRRHYDPFLFEQWHEEINGQNKAAKETARLDIEVRLRRLAADLEVAGVLDFGAEKGSTGIESKAVFSKVEIMASYIADHYQENIKAADIARVAALNENYAMHIFRRACGVTLLQYLTQHRLWHAQRLLTTTDLKLIQVAQMAGFGSDTRFYEVFKRNCNVSPREFRMKNQVSAALELKG